MTDTATVAAPKHRRFWEIDLLRTIAVAMMIIFHTLYLMDFFGIRNTNVPGPFHGFWWWFPRVTGGIFIFLAGVSLTITCSQSKRASGFILRGFQIFGLGMLITVITWSISTEDYVKFGILHFFGVAFILAPLFTRFRYVNLMIGAALMGAGIHLQEQGILVSFPWLLWLGLMPRGFRTWDYWPLLPWFGLFLIGMFCGKMLYPDGKRGFRIPELNNPIASALTLPGRHPLIVYLAQWPAIIGILLVLFPARVLPYFPPLPF